MYVHIYCKTFTIGMKSLKVTDLTQIPILEWRKQRPREDKLVQVIPKLRTAPKTLIVPW